MVCYSSFRRRGKGIQKLRPTFADRISEKAIDDAESGGMTVSQEYAPVSIRDRFVTVNFSGTKIAELSWTYEEAERRGYARWTDLALYRVEPPSRYCYVLHTVGKSAVYHAAGGSCDMGSETTVEELRQDAERYAYMDPCPAKGCTPGRLADFDDGDSVFIEDEIPSVWKFETTEDAVRYLSGEDGRRSGLNIQILEKAIRVDAGLREAAATRTMPL